MVYSEVLAGGWRGRLYRIRAPSELWGGNFCSYLVAQ
jgi:hypothetical protein